MPTDQLSNPQWLHQQYVDARLSARNIATAIGCDKDAVLRALRRHGIPARPNTAKGALAGPNRRRHTDLYDVDWLRERYVSDAMSTVEIAAAVGCSAPHVFRALISAGITPRTKIELGPSARAASMRHGMHNTPTYTTWAGLNQRCYNPADEAHWPLYGGRGIIVCSRWRAQKYGGTAGAFERFLIDMGERPAGMSIDRIDTDGHYEPGNCRWATPQQQAANRRPR